MRDWWIFRSLCLAGDDGASPGGDSSPGQAGAADGDRVTSVTNEPGSSSSSTSQPGATSPGSPAVDMAALRDLVLAAHADVVPEMIAGSSFDDLMASVGPAQAAYTRIVESVRGSTTVQPPAVPAGGGTRTFSINIEELSPGAKIAEGLRQRNAKR